MYQQLTVDKPASISTNFSNFFSCGTGTQNRTVADRSGLERDYFITITSDGILKSDNHLMESKISSMIPFTNQLLCEPSVTKQPESHLSFKVKSCIHEEVDIHFYKDYAKALNFVLGLRMALKESSYNETHRFESFAQMRKNCASRLYNDGAGYFEDLYNELMNAHQ